jgi:large subunit ribosomal protein L17
MRHGKKDNHLGRTHSHREAMLENMAASLILHKRIETTLSKAKELRKFVEPLLTRSKEDSTHNRRILFKSLHNKETMKELFNVVADKIADRPGGYTRIIKLGNRAGDNAETCLIELVDFNETLLNAAAEQKATRTRRGRRSSGSRKADDATEMGFATEASVIDTEVEVIDEAPEAEVMDETPVAEVETIAEEVEAVADEVVPVEAVSEEVPTAETETNAAEPDATQEGDQKVAE